MEKNFTDIKTLFFNNKSIKQTIFKNTFWLTVAEVIQGGIGFLISIWMARYFGPTIYGQWAFALSFVALFAVFADFGFNTLTIRELARDKSKSAQYIDDILVMKLILGIITLGLIAFFIQFLGKEPEVIKLVYFLGIYTVLNTFASFFQSIFRANEKMEYETLCRIIQGISLLGLVAFFILNKGSILTISYAYIGAALIGIAISLIFVWRYFSKFFLKVDLKTCKEILKEAWFFGLNAILVSIYYNIGIVILAFFKTDIEVGWYNAANKLILFLFIIPSLFSSVFFPLTSRLYKNSTISLKNVSGKFFKLMLIISIPLALLITFLAPKIILIFYGYQYKPSIPVLRILIWGTMFAFIGIPLENLFYSINKQYIVTLEVGLGAILNIVLNIILIPLCGYIGVSIAATLTWIFEFIFIFFIISKTDYKLNIKHILTSKND